MFYLNFCPTFSLFLLLFPTFFIDQSYFFLSTVWMTWPLIDVGKKPATTPAKGKATTTTSQSNAAPKPVAKKWTKEDDAARKIQTLVRGFLGRCTLKRLRKEKEEYEEKMEQLEKEVSLHIIVSYHKILSNTRCMFKKKKFYKLENVLLYMYIYHKAPINSYCVEIDFSRQNLTSVDVRFWRLKSIPAL